jgi:hypothetical protein
MASKGYFLSMIEAAMNISNNTIPIEIMKNHSVRQEHRETYYFTRWC